MTIHPVRSLDLPPTALQQRPDSAAYDSVWGATQAPTQAPTGLERVMLPDGKIYVVLAVVLIIWFGLLFFLFRTDRKIDRLERRLEPGISDDENS